ncbi:hypothetical protein Ciccas_005377 [Cichlidogyrus casuarinus]|uniref:39S ribosomal protein L52, mitochondrial n=1 Tax=Cichlidogyrus casuarinus TaxID=1844966 RepID=A0ABD2Q8V0_9PLAT
MENWEVRVSGRRPWYGMPQYYGPKTMLEERLNEQRALPRGNMRNVYLERELQTKRRELNKVLEIAKSRQALAEEALSLAKSLSIARTPANEPFDSTLSKRFHRFSQRR